MADSALSRVVALHKQRGQWRHSSARSRVWSARKRLIRKPLNATPPTSSRTVAPLQPQRDPLPAPPRQSRGPAARDARRRWPCCQNRPTRPIRRHTPTPRWRISLQASEGTGLVTSPCSRHAAGRRVLLCCSHSAPGCSLLPILPPLWRLGARRRGCERVPCGRLCRAEFTEHKNWRPNL